MKTMTKTLVALLSISAYTAQAETLTLKDPAGDDNGHGAVIYPTAAIYKPGAFDLREFKLKTSGGKGTFEVKMNSKLEDVWAMGSGFSTQMVFVFIDTDNKPGSGFTQGLPGLNINFDPKHAWDKVVILSPQKKSRVTSEAKIKAEKFKDAIIVPNKTKGKGKKISAKVDLKDIAASSPKSWHYQVVVQSNEGFPAKTDLLTRRINEYEGQHRFGGGHDMDCDPHVIDMLAGQAKGDKSEAAAQHKQLTYQCSEEGQSLKMAQVEMIKAL